MRRVWERAGRDVAATMNGNGWKMHYFDNNATTRVAPEVVEAMGPFFTELWGNPSSAYRFAREVERHLELARERVAALIRAEPREIVFTSCGTESNNAALNSALRLNAERRHVLTTAVEHSAVRQYGEQLRRRGYDVEYLPVGADGLLDVDLLERSLRPDTAIVSVMWANNETGVLFPVAEIAERCRRRGVLFHTDAVQAAGKVPVDVKAAGVDFLSLSAHKLHAPKGIGVLYIRRRTRFEPFLVGGHQERGRRAGTENVPYIVGFGRAAELALARLEEENTRVRALRDRLEATILREIPHTRVNGSREFRLPNTSNLSFRYIEAEAVLMLLDRVEVCASSGSACTTGSVDPSHVLRAMGLSPMEARGSIRFSLGRETTDADVNHLLTHLPGIVSRLRAISPLNPEHPDNAGYVATAARAMPSESPSPLAGDAEPL